MSVDLLSSGRNASLLSSILRVKLWDPKHQEELIPADVSTGIMIKLDGKPTKNTYLVYNFLVLLKVDNHVTNIREISLKIFRLNNTSVCKHHTKVAYSDFGMVFTYPYINGPKILFFSHILYALL